MTRAVKIFLALLTFALPGCGLLSAQVVSTGAGSYTTTLPAGATAPPSTVYTTQTGPVETHRFWSGKNWYPLGYVSGNSAYNMLPQPLQSTVTPQGMSIGIHGNNDGYPANDGTATAFYQYVNLDLTIGNASLNATSVNISASSDWSADFNFGPSLTIRLGRGMPFAYALTDGTPVSVTFARTPTVVTGTGNVLAVSTAEGDSNFTNYYGLFCPTGGTWAQNGNAFTCTAPSGSNYMSVALLPGMASASNLNATTISQQLTDYAKVAFSFPTDTQVSWDYNPTASTISTTYSVTTQSMDGSSTGFLMALYPHQYDAMPASVNTAYTYLTNHGTMKVNSGSSFTTVDTFHGILPFLPPTTNYNLAKLKTLVDAAPTASIQGDDYAQAKNLGAVAQVLPLASIADPAAFTTLDNGLETTMQNWYTATSSKSADLFYYDSTWSTMIAYPASFGSDTSLNDHHFHYGYFIHAAAMDGLFHPSWVSPSNWGGMVSLLQQDIANYDRSNTMFPFLRHFDIYAGHSWANGSSPFIDGENEESSSEAMNAWTGMILLGAATGDTKLRDAGIWLYTQESKGVAYYWLNEQPAWVNANAASTFPTWFAPLRIANAYDDKADEATFFGTNPDFEHAIEFLPFTGGSLHLGLSPTYVQKNYNEDVAANVANGNATGDWPDLMAMYEALADPATALTQWQAVTAATDGESLAHEYAWIMSLQALGQVDASVTANTPFYAVFNNGGTISHVAFNPTSTSLSVAFSDGAQLSVPADTMTSDSPLVNSVTLGSGVITAQPPAAPTGVTATAKSATEIDLAWTLTSGVTYNVYRSTTSGFTPSSSNEIAIALSAASYSDMHLTAATTYYYVVEAVNSGGNSAPSSPASATTSAGGGGGTTVPEANTLFLVGGATATTPSLLSFTNGTSGTDNIPANSPQSPGTPENPLVYTITGVNGTYDSSMSTAFNLFVDAGTNAGEAAQVEVLYDLTGSGTFDRTEIYNYFATNAAIDFENYTQSDRGGIQTATGSLGNMTNGTIVIKVWDALPGSNAAPIALTVGNNSAGISNLIIPFNTVSQTLTAPVTPTGLKAVATSSSAVTVTWNASTTSGVSYSLFRSTASGFTPSASTLLAAQISATTYSDLNLNASTIYYYIVEAVNGLGSSAPSAAASVTTPASNGPTPGSNTLFLVAGATATVPSKLSFVAGPAGADTISVNTPQSPDTPLNPLVYTITGLNGTYDSTMATAFNLFVDAGTNAGEAAQVEVLYDPTGSGTFTRTELYHFFATDPIVGYEEYQQNSRGGLETATGSLSDMTNGTVQILVWNALPGPNAAPMTLSVGNNANSLSEIVIPFNSITQNPAGLAAPTNFTATAKSNVEVDLAWTASTTQGVTYKVYRSTASGFTPGSGNQLASISATSYADTTVTASTTYYYVVASENAAGTGAAAQVTVTTPAPPKLVTTTSLSLSAATVQLGGTETLTASVAPSAATGTIAFKDGNTVLQTVALVSSQATFTTPSLTGGAHNFTANYSGDATYAASSSTAESVSVPTVPPNFAIASTTSSALVPAGGSATFNLTITPVGDFNSPITFSCSGLPALAACSFSPATVTPNGIAASTTSLSITTAGRSATVAAAAQANTGKGMPALFLACLPLGFGVFLVGARKRRKLMARLLVGNAMLLLLCMFAACGGSSKPTTPTSVSTVTVTATSGAVTQTTSVTLDVQQY